jgi:hypothetical protein
VFLWGVLAMGIYGIVQFYVLPPWDAYWMREAPIGSIGQPKPFEVRVWSTMNAPGPFAGVMMAGLLFAFAAKGPLRFVAAVPGYVSFLLSLVRSNWLGWAIGAVFLLGRVQGRQKITLLAVGALLSLFILPLVLLGSVAEKVTARFETMQQVDKDQSYGARLALYRDFILVSMTDVVGEGIGATGVATKLANGGKLGGFGDFDSGVLQIMYVLGWPGTILLVGGLCWLLTLAFAGGIPPSDVAAQAARAIVVTSLALLLASNSFLGVAGMVFWSFLGLRLSARTFHREQKSALDGSNVVCARGLEVPRALGK